MYYPNDLYPIALPDEVRPTTDGKGTIIRPTSLRHRNMLVGAAGSWRSVYATTRLPEGTPVRIVETERNNDNEVTAYLIDVIKYPAGFARPTGYVRTRDVRAATSAEIGDRADPGASNASAKESVSERFDPASTRSGSTQPADAASETTERTEQQKSPAPAINLDGDEPDAVEQTVTSATAPTSQPATDQVDRSLLMPMVEDLPALATDGRTTPSSGGEQMAEGTGQVIDLIGDDDVEATSTAAPPEPRDPIQMLRDLEPMRQTINVLGDAEVDELLAEYKRVLLVTNDPRLRQAAETRMKQVQLVKDARARSARIRDVLEQQVEVDEDFADRVQRWERSQTYTMVGRLVPSTLYNGDRLPLMYRLESVTRANGPRTLGYVKPGDEGIRSAALGQVVGVIGESNYDPALRLLMITPLRVDVLGPTEPAAGTQ
ncbi:MAG: hypothetical protein CMJ31_02595 [Phycisphaerae bacterium]|nr:hypothetical protein [Phycisphaerae bacterium]